MFQLEIVLKCLLMTFCFLIFSSFQIEADELRIYKGGSETRNLKKFKVQGNINKEYYKKYKSSQYFAAWAISEDQQTSGFVHEVANLKDAKMLAKDICETQLPKGKKCEVVSYRTPKGYLEIKNTISISYSWVIRPKISGVQK